MTTSTRTSTTPGWWLATVASTAGGEGSLPGFSTSARTKSTSAGPASAVEVEEDDLAAGLPASEDAGSEGGSGVLPSTTPPEEAFMPPPSTDISPETAPIAAEESPGFSVASAVE